MVDKFKYYIVLNDVRHEIHPTKVRSLQTIFKRVEGIVYSHEIDISDTINLSKEDFNLFYGIETSSNRCGDIRIIIEKLCPKSGGGNEYILFAEGILRAVDGNYDLDKCNVDVKITAIDPYYCYEYNKAREINIFDAKPYNQRVKANVLQGTIETHLIEWPENTPFIPYDVTKFGGQDPRMLGWVIYRNEVWRFGPNVPGRGGSPGYKYKTYYAREVITIPCSDPNPVGWTLVTPCSGGVKKFARPVVKMNYQRLLPNNYDPEGDVTPVSFRPHPDLTEDSLIFSWDVMGLNGVPSVFDNGMHLIDVLNHFIGQFCSMEVRSNFFQVNATQSFESAYPQLPADGRTLHNIIYQKSDVKRLNASNNATKGLTTIEKLIEAVCVMYNLQYRIEDGYFNIEHVSYWDRAIKLDVTQVKYEKYIKGTNKYEYNHEALPQFEEFKMMESGSADFTGTPIEYFGRCMTLEEYKIKTFQSSIITTDVEHCMENSEPGSNKVSDDGFVIMATVLEGGNYYVQRFAPILERATRVNNPLSWAHLINAFYRHERPQKHALMNNAFVDFFTTKPVRKQPTISIPWCCGDELDLTGLVKTPLGEGIIDQAKLNHYTELLELDLIYANPYQEIYCTPLTLFTVNRVTSTSFFFNVELLDCSKPHSIVVEVTRPNGSTYVTQPISTSCEGIVEIVETPVAGVYKFRARQLCEGAISEWTDYNEVNYTTQGDCGMLPTVTFIRQDSPGVFRFSFPDGSAFNDAVDVEVTTPSNSTSTYSNVTIELQTSNNTIAVIVDIVGGRTGPVRIFPGVYKFRFRRLCGAYTTSLFTDYINVTVS